MQEFVLFEQKKDEEQILNVQKFEAESVSEAVEYVLESFKFVKICYKKNKIITILNGKRHILCSVEEFHKLNPESKVA